MDVKLRDLQTYLLTNCQLLVLRHCTANCKPEACYDVKSISILFDEVNPIKSQQHNHFKTVYLKID